MNKPIAIIAGEPNSIASEIIFKSWINRKKFKHKNFFIIGSFKLFNLQKKKLNIKIKLKKIDFNFTSKDLKGNNLPIYNVDYNQKKPFLKITSKSNNYIFKCFEEALRFKKKDKIVGLINCPISKESLFKKKHQGITEFLSNKVKMRGKEVMLIYNDKLSVSPITTHIPLKTVSRIINAKLIISKTLTINSFYKKSLKKKPRIAILGLNPHNFGSTDKSEEETITVAINKLKKLKISVDGPISPDSSFLIYKKNKYDVIIGMYHDQVLTPFKALFKFDAINITLGLPFIRISPDHGIGSNIVGKKVANEKSLIESIKFFNKVRR